MIEIKPISTTLIQPDPIRSESSTSSIGTDESTTDPKKKKKRKARSAVGNASAGTSSRKGKKPRQSITQKTKKSKDAKSHDTKPTSPASNFDHIVWGDDFQKPPNGLYEAIKKLWPSDLEGMLETEEAMNIAHQYHMASIPENERLKVLVLGESHSRTPNEIIGRQIPDKFNELIPEKMRNLGHLNLVHCLSYGELHLLVDKEESANYAKASTATWWKVLATLAGRCAPDHNGTDPLLGCQKKAWTETFKDLVCGCGSPGSAQREQLIKNKVQILEDLKRFRIGLMDISPIAIFLASGTETKVNKKTGNRYQNPIKKLDSRSYSAIMELCWSKYMLPLIRKLIRPDKIIILGETIFKFLEKRGLNSLKKEGISVQGFIHPSARTYQQVRSDTTVLMH
jgi:hypothetical protein